MNDLDRMTPEERRLERARDAYDAHTCLDCTEDRECLVLHGLVDELAAATRAVEDLDTVAGPDAAKAPMPREVIL